MRKPASFAATLLILGAFLGGCTSGTANEPSPPIAAGPCRAADFASLKGKPESVLAATTFPQGLTIRVIHPGDAVTMDYSDMRVNVLVDAHGTISDITCG